MLRVIENSSASGAKSYYSTADYYSEGQELEGQWRGAGATRLGLQGKIERSEWDALCDNRDPETGKKLTPRQKENRRVGYDFNFHVPKSVSVLYAFTGDERVLDAFHESVDATMQDIEAEMKTRVRIGASNDDRVTGNMVWGEFVHFTARPVDGVPDPHLHAHCFAFNTTWDAQESRWKAGQFADLKRDAPFFEVTFHSRLAHALAERGVAIERTARGWEVAGIPTSALRKFSRRTALIDEMARAEGITDPAEKGALGAKTRKHKSKNLTSQELKGEWTDRLTMGEREAIKAVAAALDALDGKGMREAAASPTGELEAVSPAAAQQEQQNERPMDDLRAEPPDQHEAPDSVAPTLAASPAKRAPVAARTAGEEAHRAADAVDRAIEHCFERSSVVPERKLLADAIKRSYGLALPQDVASELASRPLVRGARGGQALVTTPAIIAEERRMIAFARDGRGTCSALAPGGYVPSRDWLGEDQQRAVRHVLESRDRVVVVRGAAGTGKTTMMQEAAEAIERGGSRVFAFAPSAQASRGVLREAGFANADTVARLLVDERLQQEAKGGVWWIDEAGLLGTRTMGQLFELAKREDARIVLSGDRRQHGSVERGSALRLLETEAGIVPAEIRTIQRQTGGYKQAVEALSRGNVASAFAQLDRFGWIKQVADGDRYVALARDYVEATERGDTALVIAPTHAEGARVTAAIRSTLKDAGRLGRDEREFTTLENANLTLAERSDPHELRVGDVAVFHQNAKGHANGERVVVGEAPLAYDQAAKFQVFHRGSLALAPGDLVRITRNGATADGKHRLNNGAVYAVKGFTKRGDVELANGWTVSRDFGHLASGYVSTSHASQGRSVKRVLIAQSAESFPVSSRQQFYVSISRGQKQATIYTDDKAALLEAVARSDERLSATELAADARAKAPARRRRRTATAVAAKAQSREPELGRD